jgi:hypothetical protein
MHESHGRARQPSGAGYGGLLSYGRTECPFDPGAPILVGRDNSLADATATGRDPIDRHAGYRVAETIGHLHHQPVIQG